jgi:hypothetical protein
MRRLGGGAEGFECARAQRVVRIGMSSLRKTLVVGLVYGREDLLGNHGAIPDQRRDIHNKDYSLQLGIS